MAELLIDNGADIESRDYEGWTPLLLAAKEGKVAVSELLLARGADINQHRCDITALYLAVQHGHQALVQYLLHQTAKRDPLLLHVAAQNGHDSVVQVLLREGFEVTVTTDMDETPLHYASQWGHRSTVELLISAGASVDAKNFRKETALLVAATQGHQDVMETLLERNKGVLAAKDDKERTVILRAILAAKDAKKRTALHLAAQKGHESAVRLLLRCEIDLEYRDNLGKTALLCIIDPVFWLRSIRLKEPSSQETIMELLLKAGADVHKSNYNGEYAIHVAVHSGKSILVKVLLNTGRTSIRK